MECWVCGLSESDRQVFEAHLSRHCLESISNSLENVVILLKRRSDNG